MRICWWSITNLLDCWRNIWPWNGCCRQQCQSVRIQCLYPWGITEVLIKHLQSWWFEQLSSPLLFAWHILSPPPVDLCACLREDNWEPVQKCYTCSYNSLSQTRSKIHSDGVLKSVPQSINVAPLRIMIPGLPPIGAWLVVVGMAHISMGNWLQHSTGQK